MQLFIIPFKLEACKTAWIRLHCVLEKNVHHICSTDFDSESVNIKAAKVKTPLFEISFAQCLAGLSHKNKWAGIVGPLSSVLATCSYQILIRFQGTVSSLHGGSILMVFRQAVWKTVLLEFVLHSRWLSHNCSPEHSWQGGLWSSGWRRNKSVSIPRCPNPRVGRKGLNEKDSKEWNWIFWLA